MARSTRKMKTSGGRTRPKGKKQSSKLRKNAKTSGWNGSKGKNKRRRLNEKLRKMILT